MGGIWEKEYLCESKNRVMEIQKTYPWGDTRRFNSYSRYFNQLFGGRVQKVTINAGFTCPNRDGSKGFGGCSFCNNEAFNPSYCIPQKGIVRQIEEGKQFHEKRYRKSHRFLAYFQAYSNTYKPLSELIRIYDEALAVEDVVGLVIGTRPDCIDNEKLDYFAELSQKYYVIIEYGVESCYNATLKAVNRCHLFEESVNAIQKTAARGIHVGAHFILGLPGETREMMISQTELINRLPLTTIKFHQLQIFKNTLMAKEYQEHPDRFQFFSLEEYIALFAEILCRLSPNIVLERFAGEAPPRYHLSPSWGMIRNEELLQRLEQYLEKEDLWQGCRL